MRTLLQVVGALIEGFFVNSARPFSTRSARRRRVAASIAGGTLLAAGAFGAFPATAGGANGTVQISLAAGANGNVPKVPCTFSVEFSGFDVAQSLVLEINNSTTDLPVIAAQRVTMGPDGSISHPVTLDSVAMASAGVSNIEVIYSGTDDHGTVHRKSKMIATTCAAEAPVVVTEPLVVEPIVVEPIVTEPIVTEPLVVEPIVTEPIVVEPIVTEPIVVVTEPLVTGPTEPIVVVTEPVVTEPAEPIVTEPIVVVTEPVVTEPVIIVVSEESTSSTAGDGAAPTSADHPNDDELLTTSASGADTALTSATDDGGSSTAEARTTTPSTTGAPVGASSSQADATPVEERLETAGEVVTLPRTGPTAKAGATAAATIVGLLGLAAARLRRRLDDETAGTS